MNLEKDHSDAPADLLGREKFATALTQIVKSFEGEAVIVLDGEWGIGKTHFIKDWQRAGTCKAIYFDAFQGDYHPEPFIPLCATLMEQFPAAQSTKRLLEKSKAVGVAICKTFIRVGLKAATAGVVDTKDDMIADIAGAVRDDVAEISTQALGDYVENSIKDFTKAKLSFQEFREVLAALASEVDKNKRPLVFIVDELDRCRPSFAVELLEQIKHLFSVPGVVFLLVLNHEQLASAIKTQYGCNDESSWKYLRKFVDITLTLPHVELSNVDSARTVQFLNYQMDRLFNQSECDPVFGKSMRYLCYAGGAAARDIQQIARLSFVIHLTGAHFLRVRVACQVLACLTFLSVVSPFLFAELQTLRALGAGGDSTLINIRKRLGLVGGNTSSRSGGDEADRNEISLTFNKFCESIRTCTEFKHDNWEENPYKILQVVKHLLPSP